MFTRDEYEEYMKSPIWEGLRQQRFGMCEKVNIDDEYCPKCENPSCVSKATQVHHKIYPEVLGAESVDDLQALCKTCHEDKDAGYVDYGNLYPQIKIEYTGKDSGTFHIRSENKIKFTSHKYHEGLNDMKELQNSLRYNYRKAEKRTCWKFCKVANVGSSRMQKEIFKIFWHPKEAQGEKWFQYYIGIKEAILKNKKVGDEIKNTDFPADFPKAEEVDKIVLDALCCKGILKRVNVESQTYAQYKVISLNENDCQYYDERPKIKWCHKCKSKSFADAEVCSKKICESKAGKPNRLTFRRGQPKRLCKLDANCGANWNIIKRNKDK
jgi:hypothetical protein